MRKNEQKTADSKSEPKKAYIWNLIMLFVLAVCIILVVFAWFSSFRKTVDVKGFQLYTNDNLDIEFATYPGTVTASGTIVYATDPLKNLNNEDFDETDANNIISMFPGEKKYFKTEIYNTDTKYSTYTGNFCIQNVLINKNLITTDDGACISFASNQEGSAVQQSYDLATGYSSYDSTFVSLPSQVIYSNISVPPGDRETPSAVIYWYVTLNGSMVDNSMMEAQMMKLRNVKFIPTNLSQ